MVTILIIEDHQILRENIVEMLMLEGYHVLQADNGIHGLELATQKLPDLILTDFRLPGMEGDEIVRRLRQKPATAAIPVLVLTAYVSQKEILERFGLPRSNILIKPFALEDLLKLIETTLA